MSPRLRITRATLAVYVVLDLQRAGERAVPIINASLAGGMTCLQLRDKRGSMASVERVASAVRGKLRARGVPLVINDRLDVALGVEADAVHVGQTDEPVEELRARAMRAGASDLAIGVSVTKVDEAHEALAAGAQHLSVSPVFNTASKIDAPPAAGLEGVMALRAACVDTPIVAIGGVRGHNVEQLIDAGADGVAFVSAVTDTENPRDAVRAIAAGVQRALDRRRLNDP